MTQRQTTFGPIEVAYDDAVLVPRQWTVEQSRWAVALLEDLPSGRVLELCSGAGQIGLVVAVESGRALVQVDVDDRACGYARRNAGRAGIVADVRCGDLGAALGADELFPFVLADPPYVPSDEVDQLPEDPVGAIDGGVDGLDIARTCVALAADHLLDGGLLLIQLRSVEQADALRPDAEAHGLRVVDVRAVADCGALALLARSTSRAPVVRAGRAKMRG